MIGLAVPFTKALGLHWYFALSSFATVDFGALHFSTLFFFPSCPALFLVLSPSKLGYIRYIPIPSVRSYLPKLFVYLFTASYPLSNPFRSASSKLFTWFSGIGSIGDTWIADNKEN